jgi:hypothetical protein
MANDHWGLAFCPDKKNLVFRPIVACSDRACQPHADRVVEQDLAVHRSKFTDVAERQIERLLFKAGQQP